MRKMRMILACLMCALMPQMAKASDYPYLVFTNAEGTNVFTLTGLAAMQFSAEVADPAAEDTAAEEDGKLKLKVES